MNKIRITILSFLFAVLYFTTLHGQVASVTREQFQSAVHAELAKHIGGAYLYAKSESYKRLITYIVRKNLGLLKEHSSAVSPLSANSDTSGTFDPYVDPENQDETTVAINRVNKSFMCIGANDDAMYDIGMPVYTSIDEGASWRNYRLPIPNGIPGTTFTALGDPIIATDDNGNFYYAYLGGVSGSDIVGNISFAISQDGIEWSNATPININKTISGTADKEHISVDCSQKSPYYGRVYVVWYEFYTDGLQNGEGLNLAWSNDKCKTWSKPVSLGQEDNFQEIKTNSKGDIIISFSNSSDLGQELFVSTDGGKSFGKQQIPLNNQLSLFPLNRDGEQSLKGANGFRSFPYVAFDVNLVNDRIHAVYGNYEYVSGAMASVLYYATSDDNGASWSNQQYLGISNPLYSSLAFDRFHPWVSIDQKTGEAWALYYSSEQDPQNILSGAYRMKLTSTLSDYPQMLHNTFNPMIVESPYPFIGDYNGSDAFDSVYVATWTENRPNFTDGEIFAYLEYPKNPGSVNSVGTTIVVHGNHLWLSNAYPNPVIGSSFSLNYYVPHSSHIQFQIIDAAGKIIRQLADKNSEKGTYTEEFVIGNIAAGTYFLKLISDNEQEMTKIIIE